MSNVMDVGSSFILLLSVLVGCASATTVYREISVLKIFRVLNFRGV